MASITVAAEGQEQKYALENSTVTLGRGLESDIRLKDIKASRRHCQIVKTSHGYQCLDLSSGNGTYVNGVQIKQQPLNPGDKIQIGSTTITFNDSNGAKAAPAPQARAASGMTTKSSAAAAPPKAATAQVPVASTKKITVKADVVKPTTQAVSRAATQPLAKPSTQTLPRTGTQGVPKTGTQKVKTGTGVMKKTTHRAPTARATATQKFHADARKQKSNPVKILLIGIGVVFLGAVGFILFSGSGNEEEILKHDVEQALKKAVKLEEENNIDGAIAEYNRVLGWIGASDKWKTRAMEWRGIIKQLEDQKTQLSSAEGEFRKYKERFDKITDAEAKDFEKELKGFRDRVKDAKLGFLKELDELIERVGKQIDTAKAIDKRMDFQAKRQEIGEKFKLSDKRGVHWSNAIRAWREYIEQKVTDDNKNKAENEIRQINQRAREEIDSIGKKAVRDVEDGKKAQAIDELKSHRGRFELTESAGALQKLIEEHDK